jgi:hypothetical protein
MSENLSIILNRPFPYLASVKDRVFTAFIIAVFVYVFLLLFRPFGISKSDFNIPIFLLGYFVITFLVLLFTFFVLPKVFKNFFDSEKWTVGKLMLLFIVQLSMITILNWLYTTSFDSEIIRQLNFFSFISFTISVGVFPILFFVLIVERYLFKINQEVVNTLSHSIDKKEETKSVKLPIVSENKNESFEIDMECLLCIKSAGNYVDVYYLENDKTISKLIRTSLTKLDEYYIEFKNIQRCHRTHIVNLDNISEVTGNARNYNFHIDYLDFIIPVSRSFSKEIISELKND